jgi:hypothetical protein
MLTIDIIKVFCGFIAGYIAKEISIRLFTISFYVRFMKLFEIEILFLMTEYMKLMYTGIQALELAYEKSAEADSDKTEEFKIFRNAFEEKLTSLGNEWVDRLKKKLPYKTEYVTMKEAIRHLDTLRQKERPKVKENK